MRPFDIRQGIVVLASALFVMLVVPLFALRVDPMAYTGGRSRDDEQRTIRNTSALGTMLGELRTSMSDIMFIKTERYLHSGVAYVPHHEAQLLSVEAMGEEVDEHQSELGEDGGGVIEDPSHAGTQTLIPERERDYRGVVGMLHRQVKPWRDPSRSHLHTDGTELLPWFRIMTMNDPHYVTGYAVGGWWVSLHDGDTALAFLDEGLRNNPEAFQIRLTRGLLLLRRARSGPDADPGLTEALSKEFLLAAEQGLAQRPDATDEPVTEQRGWSPFLESDLWTACQMAVLLEQHYGNASEAVALANRFLEVFPDNPVFLEVTGNHPVSSGQQIESQ